MRMSRFDLKLLIHCAGHILLFYPQRAIVINRVITKDL